MLQVNTSRFDQGGGGAPPLPVSDLQTNDGWSPSGCGSIEALASRPPERMDRIRPQKPIERLSERLSSRTRKLVETAAICRLRRPWTVFIPDAKTCLCRPFMTRWTVFAPRDRINAPLSGFHPKHGNSSVSAVIRCLRTISPPPPRNPAETHFSETKSFTGRRITPVSPVTRIQSPIKEKT